MAVPVPKQQRALPASHRARVSIASALLLLVVSGVAVPGASAVSTIRGRRVRSGDAAACTKERVWCLNNIGNACHVRESYLEKQKTGASTPARNEGGQVVWCPSPIQSRGPEYACAGMCACVNDKIQAPACFHAKNAADDQRCPPLQLDVGTDATPWAKKKTPLYTPFSNTATSIDATEQDLLPPSSLDMSACRVCEAPAFAERMSLNTPEGEDPADDGFQQAQIDAKVFKKKKILKNVLTKDAYMPFFHITCRGGSINENSAPAPAPVAAPAPSPDPGPTPVSSLPTDAPAPAPAAPESSEPASDTASSSNAELSSASASSAVSGASTAASSSDAELSSALASSAVSGASDGTTPSPAGDMSSEQSAPSPSAGTDQLNTISPSASPYGDAHADLGSQINLHDGTKCSFPRFWHMVAAECNDQNNGVVGAMCNFARSCAKSKPVPTSPLVERDIIGRPEALAGEEEETPAGALGIDIESIGSSPSAAPSEADDGTVREVTGEDPDLPAGNIASVPDHFACKTTIPAPSEDAGASWDACVQACDADSTCHGAQLENERCSFCTSSAVEELPSSGARVGLKFDASSFDAQDAGNTCVSKTPAAEGNDDLASCQEVCTASDECKGFVYYVKEGAGRLCWTCDAQELRETKIKGCERDGQPIPCAHTYLRKEGGEGTAEGQEVAPAPASQNEEPAQMAPMPDHFACKQSNPAPNQETITSMDDCVRACAGVDTCAGAQMKAGKCFFCGSDTVQEAPKENVHVELKYDTSQFSEQAAGQTCVKKRPAKKGNDSFGSCEGVCNESEDCLGFVYYVKEGRDRLCWTCSAPDLRETKVKGCEMDGEATPCCRTFLKSTK